MQKYTYHSTLLGQVDSAYGVDAYGSGAYNQTGQVTQTGQDSGSNNGGLLANTGYDIVLPLALGAAMVVGSIIALVRMRRKKVNS